MDLRRVPPVLAALLLAGCAAHDQGAEGQAASPQATGSREAVPQHGHPEAYPDTCRPVPVAGLRVTLPGDATPAFVAEAGEECSAVGVNPIGVHPIVAGLSGE